MGPDGQLWATGWAHSALDDEAFGGTVGGWTDARDLSWIARRDCVADGCSWEVFTSDDTPELLTTVGQSEWPNDVGDVAIGADGTVYASVGENQLVVYDGSGWDAHTVPDLPTGWNGSVTPWSSSLAVGTDGLVWAGTNSGDTGRGLFMFDGAEFTHLTSADGLPDDNAFQVAVASDGTIWVATDVLYGNPEFAPPDAAAGIATFDGTSWTTYTLADGLLSNDGIVAAGPDGTVWVVHDEVGQRGYARFDGTGWTAYPSDLPVGGFRAVVDSEGTLWSTAEDGLVRFDGTTKTVYESPFALDEQAVFSFADDDLCEWVSEEDVAEFVAAEFDWQGTAGNQGRPYPEAVCEWTLSGSAHSAVIAEDAGRWKDFDGNPYKISETEIVEYEGGTVNIGASVVGHPAVSDGVVVHNGGFGMFAFGVPPDSEWLGVQVHVDPEGVEWNAEHEARYFAVADHFVEELGWLAER
jgi:membrane protein implicated in regulation of membrane protease activity